MATLTITAGNVVPGSNAQMVSGYAGEAITAGQVVYLDPTTGKYLKADGDSATVAARVGVGIALNGASLNQPIDIQTAGDITIGATTVANTAYYLAATAGAIGVLADVTTGVYMQLIGIAISTSVIRLSFLNTGVAN